MACARDLTLGTCAYPTSLMKKYRMLSAPRPRGSRLGAWASRQSEVIPSRSALQSELDRFDKEFEGRDVPRPDHWGGFRVALERVEFWQGQPARIHDRLLYHRTVDGWRTERLSP